MTPSAVRAKFEAYHDIGHSAWLEDHYADLGNQTVYEIFLAGYRAGIEAAAEHVDSNDDPDNRYNRLDALANEIRALLPGAEGGE